VGRRSECQYDERTSSPSQEYRLESEGEADQIHFAKSGRLDALTCVLDLGRVRAASSRKALQPLARRSPCGAIPDRTIEGRHDHYP